MTEPETSLVPIVGQCLTIAAAVFAVIRDEQAGLASTR
jgi:hypothetical protein